MCPSLDLLEHPDDPDVYLGTALFRYSISSQAQAAASFRHVSQNVLISRPAQLADPEPLDPF